MNRTIKPAASLSGKVSVPGDKSISHRALILASLAQGRSVITNLSPGLDVQSTASCLQHLGIGIEIEDSTARVNGGGESFSEPDCPLNAGNSGTTMRLLAGILAAQPFSSVLQGDEYLNRRPMDRIILPLKQMGASIRSNAGRAPLTIEGAPLSAIAYASPVASAQVKSCLLLAGLFCSGRTAVTEPARSRDHTERMLPCFGVPVCLDDCLVAVNGPAPLRAANIDIPGDISSAAFLIAAAAMIPGSDLTIQQVGLNKTRTGILPVLRRMGADITVSNENAISGEPRADIRVKGSLLTGTHIEGPEIPSLIDELPVLAVTAALAGGVTVIKDAGELQVKETDRIAATAANLQAMGVDLEIREDGWKIAGPQPLRGAVLESRGDHRIAMAFAVAGLAAAGKTVIRNAGCADISFPGFYNLLENISND